MSAFTMPLIAVAVSFVVTAFLLWINGDYSDE